MEQLNQYLEVPGKDLKGKKFFGGDTMGIVDIAANFIAFWAIVLQEVAWISLINEEIKIQTCAIRLKSSCALNPGKITVHKYCSPVL